MAGEHLEAANEMLKSIEPITSGRGGDPQLKATAAVAHALLALVEQREGGSGS